MVGPVVDGVDELVDGGERGSACRRLVICRNQSSTRFSQLLEVGVKCRWTRLWRASQARTLGCLWVATLSQITCDVLRGDWIDPRRSRETFGHWAQQWLATTTHLQPKTQAGYESILSKHLLPAFGSDPLASIDHPVFFLSDLAADGLGRGTVRNIRDVLRLVLAIAVRSGAIKHNPVLGARLGRSAKQEMVFLTADQVMTLANETTSPPIRQRGGEHPARHLPGVRPTGTVRRVHGAASGEIGALRVRRLDLMRRRAEVAESASEARGQLQLGATKTYPRSGAGGAHRAARPACRRQGARRIRVRRARRRPHPALQLVPPSLQTGRRPSRTT